MEIFYLTLTQMLVMFCFIAIGFVLKKAKLLPDDAGTVLSKLENYVLVPAMIINSFMEYCNVDNLKANYKIVLFSTGLTLLGIALAMPLSRFFAKEKNLSGKEAEYRRNIYKYALSFGNFAFMGNAIALGVLGDAGLFKYLLFTLPLNIAVYGWGTMILIPKGEEKKSVLSSLLNPVFISLLVGVVLGLTGVKRFMPQFFTTTIDNAKNCMGPIAMILTGFIVGGYGVKGLLKKKRIYLAAFLRLIVIPGAMLLLIRALGADDEIMQLALFGFATPLGLNTIVFPAAYGGDTKTGASMALISHTLSVITLPVMYLIFIALI